MQALNLDQIQLYLKGRTVHKHTKWKGKNGSLGCSRRFTPHFLCLLYFHDEQLSSPRISCFHEISRHPQTPAVTGTCKRLPACSQICVITPHCSLCSFTPCPGSNIPHLPQKSRSSLAWVRQSRSLPKAGRALCRCDVSTRVLSTWLLLPNSMIMPEFSLPFCLWGH